MLLYIIQLKSITNYPQDQGQNKQYEMGEVGMSWDTTTRVGSFLVPTLTFS